MVHYLLIAFQTLNELLTAGVAITAFSLLLYALSFNLRDRVARSFALILIWVVIVFVSDALGSVAGSNTQLEFWLRLQWLGVAFLPASYLHLSDAILATTGRPSRGRRRLAVSLAYLISMAFLAALPFSLLVGPLVPAGQPAPHLQRTWLSGIFTLYYLALIGLSWVNFWRAYQRTVASTSRRRMRYLLAGALAPALGSYPYLLFGSSVAASSPLLFWLLVTVSNLLVTALLVLMAYSVAFFGVRWPDRVIKRRLFKWLLRGPITASTVLALTTIIRRISLRFGIDVSAIVPFVMVGSILIIEHWITLVAPAIERRLFYGKDRPELDLLQTLDERLLTYGDLQQFLEAVLSAVCDRLQVSRAFLVALGANGLEMFVTLGGDNPLKDENLSADLLKVVTQDDHNQKMFSWGEYWLIPLSDEDQLLGLLGVLRRPEQNLDGEQVEALTRLAERATLALHDRRRQQQVFNSLQELTPQMDMLQRLRAAARYNGKEILASPDGLLQDLPWTHWVKEALTHFWGGPKLTESPLIKLRVVQEEAGKNGETPANALRAILRRAIEYIRPEGERRYTGEWILYNILEMKFVEGRKVREIAARLAMSEADLYRKQRVAIEAAAKAIQQMEQEAQQENQQPTEERETQH